MKDPSSGDRRDDFLKLEEPGTPLVIPKDMTPPPPPDPLVAPWLNDGLTFEERLAALDEALKKPPV
jgi:hypothetical protein